MFYRLFIKPILFWLPPESAHTLTFQLIRWLFPIPGFSALIFKDEPLDATEAVVLWGLKFPNRVGLAAGFDKDAELVKHWQKIGFGFVEVGTVTPKPQYGNEKPRLFRLPKDEALINRMGFNNKGAGYAASNLRSRNHNWIIGGNIGKNKDTPNEEAIRDYMACLQALHPLVDFFTVNISSPNTPGLRALQEKEPLRKLLIALVECNSTYKVRRPLLLKIAPDLTTPQVEDVLQVILEVGFDGIIVSNTTLDRSNLCTDAHKLESIGAGGLSGRPLKNKSTELVRFVFQKTQGKLPIIAVGGILSAEDALEKLEAGASLVQLYTGLVYKGPNLVTEIRRALKHKKNVPSQIEL
jgi:dihydroorotate dehydrogenase